MEAQKPQDPNNLSELEAKHWPQIQAIRPKLGVKFAIKISVGKIPHPVTDEHLIVFIEVFYGNKPIGKKFLKPGDAPQADFEIYAKIAEIVRVNQFCNLHGLWTSELKIF